MYKIQRKEKKVKYSKLSFYTVFIHNGKLCLKYPTNGGSSSMCVLTRNENSGLEPSIDSNELVTPVKILEVVVEEI